MALLGAPLVLLGSSDTPFAFLAGLVPLWAAGIAIYGLAQIILAVLPAAGRARLLSGRLPWWSVAVSLLTVAVVVQWTRVVSGSAVSFWARQRLNDDPARTRLTLFGDPCGAITALHDPATPLGGVASALRGSLVTFPETLLGSVAELVPFVVLVGMIGVLGAAGTAGTLVTPTAAETPAHPSEPPHWVRSSLIFLFAAFVVGYGGTLLGFRFPIQFALAWLLLVLTLRRNLLGPDSAESGAQAIAERPHAHAFRIKGALAEVQAAAVRSATYKAWLPSATDAKPNRVAQWQLASRPVSLSPRDLALALGPRENWWGNGLLALKRGAVLAIVPVAFYLYVLVTTQMGQYVSERAQFGAIALVIGVASEVAFWLVAAFVLGSLYPLLRGDNGPTKGLVLAAIFLGSYIPALLLSGLEDAPWLVRAFQLALFLVALGVWLDLETLRAGNVYWRYIFPLYQIRSVQGVARYIAPILPIIVIVLRQLQSGEATAAIESILEVLGKEFPE
jgi:hypothetical protein